MKLPLELRDAVYEHFIHVNGVTYEVTTSAAFFGQPSDAARRLQGLWLSNKQIYDELDATLMRLLKHGDDVQFHFDFKNAKMVRTSVLAQHAEHLPLEHIKDCTIHLPFNAFLYDDEIDCEGMVRVLDILPAARTVKVVFDFASLEDRAACGTSWSHVANTIAHLVKSREIYYDPLTYVPVQKPDIPKTIQRFSAHVGTYIVYMTRLEVPTSPWELWRWSWTHECLNLPHDYFVPVRVEEEHELSDFD